MTRWGLRLIRSVVTSALDRDPASAKVPGQRPGQVSDTRREPTVSRVTTVTGIVVGTAASGAGSDVTFTEAAVLVRLQREGPTSPGTIAGRERVTSQAITAVLSELRRRGLVTRSVDATDRRKVAVAITDAGHHVLRDSEQAVFDALLHALIRSFTDSELAHLHASVPLLSRLADVL